MSFGIVSLSHNTAVEKSCFLTGDMRSSLQVVTLSLRSGKFRGMANSLLEKFRQNFESEDKYMIAQNACAKTPLMDVLTSRNVRHNTQHCFSHKIEKEVKPITDQAHSGRCWIFACLNCMRVPFVKKFGLEEFEFSQNYLYFWDKVERANYLLDAFVECAKKGETYDGRLISHLLKNPSEDGGQWDMLVNLVEKYGVVPKTLYPESWCSGNSVRLGRILNNRLRENCMVLHKMVTGGDSDEKLEKTKEKMMEEIYRIMCIILGTPPNTMTFEYYKKGEESKREEHCVIGPISPHDFYHQHIKQDCFNMEDMVCIVNDPRAENPYDKLYTVQYLGNMTAGRPVLYINQPIEVLKDLAIKTLVDEKQPVWFGCDVMKDFNRSIAIQDTNVFDMKRTFGIETTGMDKAQRLMYGDSLMTHAMTFTGVNLQTEDDGKRSATKWRVENSWGTAETTNNGYLTMTDDWFSEYVYEVVVDKKLLNPSILAVLSQEPVVLPAWDPMGALA